jgi:hypothetical protein
MNNNEIDGNALPPSLSESDVNALAAERGEGGAQVGTYAHTAQVMAGIIPDFDWDGWKDSMKETGEWRG